MQVRNPYNQSMVKEFAEAFNRGALAAIASSSKDFSDIIRLRAATADDWRERAALVEAANKFVTLADACATMIALANETVAP